jgi:hypothetical protein
MLASAPPARRFFLLETRGPWPTAEVLAASRLAPPTARFLRAATASLGARLLLVRRPGRHPVSERAARWAIVERDRGVRWGSWSSEEDLLRLDLAAELALVEPAALPLALVCTQGRHDVCCAVEGRPVVAAATTDPRFDVWECSHVGGDRFAANLLLLPSGLLLGGLTAAVTPEVLSAAASGRVLLEHYRGRFGDPAPAQAAQWHLMNALGEDDPAQVAVDPVPTTGEALSRASGVVTVTAHHAGRSYRLDLAWFPSSPNHLTCRAPTETRVREWTLDSPPTALHVV